MSNSNAHLVSLPTTEADAALNSEFIVDLAGAGKGGGVSAVPEAAQVSRHCRKQEESPFSETAFVQTVSHFDPNNIFCAHVGVRWGQFDVRSCLEEISSNMCVLDF